MKTVRHRAFTLVEVVLAVGIIAFGITAMLGLLTVAVDSDKSAREDTALAAMSLRILTDLRAMPYDRLRSRSVYYFDEDGNESAQTAAVYECAVTLVDSPEVSAGHLKQVEMLFEWPRSVAVRPNKKAVHGAIANHGR